MQLKKFNLFFGLALFVAFLMTGYYMKEYFKPAHQEDYLMRLQIRSSHIYILFISLLNIIAFKCNLIPYNKLSGYLDMLFRILLIVSGIIALFAFHYEHTGIINNRFLTLITVILSVASIGFFLLHEILYLLRKRKNQ